MRLFKPFNSFYGTLDHVIPYLAVDQKKLRNMFKVNSLRMPPGNHLEALKDDRKGQHSIRINDQWRVCFKWKSDGVHDVEIVDYH